MSRGSRSYNAHKAIEQGAPDPALSFAEIKDHFLTEVWPGPDAAYEHMAWLIARVCQLQEDRDSRAA